MSFDSFAKDVAGTLSGVFGNTYTFERPNEYRSEIAAVVRHDVETVDESGQIMLIEHTVRFATKDLEFTPLRGDLVCDGSVTYTLGRRLTDNGWFIEFEATT